jgi:hypothetical protein
VTRLLSNDGHVPKAKGAQDARSAQCLLCAPKGKARWTRKQDGGINLHKMRAAFHSPIAADQCHSALTITHPHPTLRHLCKRARTERSHFSRITAAIATLMYHGSHLSKAHTLPPDCFPLRPPAVPQCCRAQAEAGGFLFAFPPNLFFLPATAGSARAQWHTTFRIVRRGQR